MLQALDVWDEKTDEAKAEADIIIIISMEQLKLSAIILK